MDPKTVTVTALFSNLEAFLILDAFLKEDEPTGGHGLTLH
jgi:hypothetical protein